MSVKVTRRKFMAATAAGAALATGTAGAAGVLARPLVGERRTSG